MSVERGEAYWEVRSGCWVKAVKNKYGFYPDKMTCKGCKERFTKGYLHKRMVKKDGKCECNKDFDNYELKHCNDVYNPFFFCKECFNAKFEVNIIWDTRWFFSLGWTTNNIDVTKKIERRICTKNANKTQIY